MTEPTNRDPVIARALRTMPVPDHGAGFWERLDAELDAADSGTPVPGPALQPGGDSPLIELRPAGAPQGSPRPRLLAVAAAVVVLLVAAALVADRSGDGQTDVAGEPAPTSAPAPEPSPPSPPPTSAPTTAVPGEPASAAGAVEAWIAAVATGDLDRAAVLLGEQSNAYLAGQDGGLEGMRSGLAEGYGAWASASPRVDEVTLLSSGEGALHVVVLSGEVEQEGATNYRVDAFPVRESGGVFRVELFAFGPGDTTAEFVTPEIEGGGGGMAPDDAIELAVPADAEVFVAVDDTLTTVPVEGGMATFDPPGELGFGTHLVVVATVGPGYFTAVATEILVEG